MTTAVEGSGLFVVSVFFSLSVVLRSGREAAVFSAKAGSVLVTLKSQHQAASIQAVEMNSQYFLLFCRSQDIFTLYTFIIHEKQPQL